MRVFLFLTNFSIQLLLNLPQPSDTIKVLLCESLFLSLYIYVSLPKRKTEIFDCLLYDCCVPCLIISPTAYLSIRQYMRLLYVTYQCLFCMYICLSLYLYFSLCIYVHLSLCTNVSLFVPMSTYLSICTYVSLSPCTYLCLSIAVCTYLSPSCLSISLSQCISLCSPVSVCTPVTYISACSFVNLSVYS